MNEFTPSPGQGSSSSAPASSGKTYPRPQETDAAPDNVAVVVIHGVGETEVGWINDYIVAELGKREPAMALDPYSQVYRLPDKGRTKPGAMFRTIVRRGRIANRTLVTFAELHWADLSRVGTGAFMRLITVLKLFFEAPQVLGTSFLNQSSSGIHGWIRTLILTALWLLRWPIAGTSLSLFASAFGLIMLRRFELDTAVPLPHVVMGLLASTALIGYLFARWRVNHDIALTDLGLAMSLFSCLMLGVVALANLLAPSEVMQHEPIYLAVAGNSIIYLWITWNVATIGAIVLIAAIWLKRFVFGSRLKRRVPLDRPANAVALAIVQGTIWKLIICPVSLAIIHALAPESVSAGCQVPSEAGNMTDWADSTVKIIAVKMVVVSVLNLGMTLIAVLAIAVAVSSRTIVGSVRGKELMAGEALLPRMIVSPVIVIALLFGLLLNVYTYYGYYDHDGKFCELRAWFDTRGWLEQLRVVTTSTTLVTVLPYFLGVVQKASTGVVHVARDIVDHQFTPRFAVARGMLPGVRPRGTYPRRERIQKRLDALMEGLVAQEPFNRLVFVTHSQGTVIMHDYLRSVRDDRCLGHIKRIDVVTLASPISHIYQQYFRAYEVQSGTAAALNPKLATWTNLWRIDDPIGGRVDIVLDGFVRNEPLPRGGHLNYWRENRVCDVILGVIDPVPEPAKTPLSADERVHRHVMKTST